MQAIEKRITIKPDYAEAHYNFGNVLKAQCCLEEAVASYRKAITIKPDYAEAHSNLGIALQKQGHLEEAVASCRKAITIKPDFAETHSNLGIALQGQGRLEEAAASCRKAITIKPDFAEAHSNLGIALQGQGRLEEAADSCRKAITIKADYAETHSNLLFCLNYFANISRKDVYNESLKWDQQHAKNILRKEPVSADKKEKERKLKIGYVSPDFRIHSVSCFFEPLLKAHNKENVEIYCYSNVMVPDNVTERLKKESDNWLSIVGKSDEDVVEQIRRDGIDILVDLAGHTAKNRLLVFAYKPAPIQVTWLGYPNTTGMSAMDYRFTDEVADPIGVADNLHSEELIRLESGFLCYSGDESAPEISALPCLEREHITFGSFNNLTKTTPEVVKLWSDILHAAPNSHLLLKNKQLMDEEMRAGCREMFEKEGVSGERVELFGTLPKKEDHLRFYSNIDIGLDPFPYNGTTTTYEALWMGVPVITLEGDRHAARVGASIMTHLNLPQFLADTKENYIKKAVELGGGRKRLAVYRKELRSILQSSKSCDEHHFAKKIEAAFREMWRTWCQSDPVFPVTVSGKDELPLEPAISPKLSSPANNAIELNIRGEELFAQGKLQEAEEIFEKALRENPHFAVIHNNLGVLQWHLGNAHNAINHLKKALSLEPENFETLGNIEAIFQQMKEAPRRDTDLPVVRILHHMARSGGTVLSKCIGCMQDIVLLSEIHPQGTNLINPLDQACRWFGLVDARELETLTNKISFIDAVSLIEERCREQSKNLVIRDWSHLDFTAVPFVAQPSYRLSLAETLADRFSLIQIATVRHPIDQWLSLCRLSVMQGTIDIETYLTGYRKFAEKCQETGFIRYEDFVQSPEEKIEKLCQDLQISYDPDFINKWWPYSTITGDINSERGSKKEIRQTPRRAIDSDTLDRFHENDDYHVSLELLGYDI